MAITGKYQHERNENLDEYFQAVGVPYIPRKMMLSSHPQVEITVNEEGEWTITTNSLFRTVVAKFKLGEEYEEHMPSGVTLKSITTQEDGKLIVESTPSTTDDKVIRIYEANETQLIITMKHEKSGKEAKRYFKRM